MGQPLRVLVVEDSTDDAVLLIQALKKGGYEPTYERVEDAEGMQCALKDGEWDLVLCDYNLPQFNGLEALELLKETGLDIPFFIVSGKIGEETAVACMKAGANDYVMKGSLSRLVPAIERELIEAESRNKRKQAEEALQESEYRLREVLENSLEVSYNLNLQTHHYDYLSPVIAKISGYTSNEIKSLPFEAIMDFIHPDDHAEMERVIAESMSGATGTGYQMNYRFKYKNGQYRWCQDRFTVMRDVGGHPLAIIGSVSDINERKQAEQELKESEQRFMNVLHSSKDAILLIDGKKFIDCNEATARMLRYPTRNEFLKTHPSELSPPTQPDGRNSFEKANEMMRIASERGFHQFEWEHRRANGEDFPVEVSLTSIVLHGKNVLHCMWRDITERKRTEDKIKEQNNAMEAAIDGMALLNDDGKYIYLNKAHVRIYGYENPGELIGKSWRTLYDTDEIQRFDAEIMPKFSRKGDWHGEATGTKKNGSKFHQELSLTALESGGLICVVRDITERKRAEEALRLSEENFRRSLDESPLGISIVSEKGEIFYANRAILDFFGYESIEELRKTPVTKRYTESNYAEFLDRKEKRRLHADDPSDYEIDIVRKDGEVRQLQVWRRRVLWNGKEHYQVIYRDITDGKLAEQKLNDTLESLRKAVGVTIQVMASAVETRDPYTSGHQTRSAGLARAIATEMGLPQDTIEGIGMAGSIHDIGKLSIPAEILSKPTKLSALELALIKEHANRGYEILKDVVSPWPLAEIVRQHHERMDGSGYPRNLKGEEILIEARILSIADTVEAMASHRPYRPGLGIDSALAEIEKNKGISYDNAVADACLRLFREKGFKLEET